MIKELDSIVLTADLPEFALASGDIGTVVMVHGDSAGYEVEFMTLNGETIAVTSLPASRVRPISQSNRIARIIPAREVDSAPVAETEGLIMQIMSSRENSYLSAVAYQEAIEDGRD